MDNHSPDLLPSVHIPPAQTAPEELAKRNEQGNAAMYKGEQSAAQQIEQGVSSSPQGQPSGTAQPQQFTQPVSPYDPSAQALAKQAPPSAGHPQIADDADLIEKEWVDKAKEIVARTSQDPYRQNKELTLMKADYLKKRYNKDVRISEDN